MSGGYFDSIYAANITHRAVAVFMYLKNRAGEDGECFPGVNTIARDLHISYRTVYRALNDLERHGFVKREERWRDTGGRSSSSYVLLDR